MNKKSKIINKFKNRQIKFRVWNIEKKKYTYPENNVYSIFWNPYLNRNEVINGCETHYNESTHISQQFTGLLDTDGKEIFEGDVLQDVKNKDGPHIVTWGNLFGGWLLVNKVDQNPDKIQWDNELYLWNKDSKIISNIFENL